MLYITNNKISKFMNGQNKTFISIREASQICGIKPQTLRKMADNNQISCYRTPSGQRKFDLDSLEKLCTTISSSDQISTTTKKNYLYSRVSSKKQMDDLARQIDYLKSTNVEYGTYNSISDIASGINFKRQGLSTILDACIQGSIGNVVVAHRDRLCRFGFDLIKLFIEKSGGSITVIDDEGNKSSEQELAEDLLSIVHIYSCRQMGRSNKSKNNIKICEDTNQT